METVTWCFLVIKFKILLSKFFWYLWRVFKQQTCMDTIRNSWMSCMIFFVVCWRHSGFLHPPVLSPEVANIKVIYIVFYSISYSCIVFVCQVWQKFTSIFIFSSTFGKITVQILSSKHAAFSHGWLQKVSWNLCSHWWTPSKRTVSNLVFLGIFAMITTI